MNYKKHYDSLILRAQNRILDSYTETHHIIPRCLDGTDDKENLVELTPEEHYVAHQLLVKIYPKIPKLVFALVIMTGKNKTIRRNKLYGWLKRKISEARTGTKHSEETRKKMSDSLKARGPLSIETRQKISQSQIGKTRGSMPEETKNKISKTKQDNPKTSWNKGIAMRESTKQKLSQTNTGKKHTKETKIKISKNHSKTSWNKGIPLTEEHRQKLSALSKGKSKFVVICPNCNKEGGLAAMKRWHFDNCKLIHTH